MVNYSALFDTARFDNSYFNVILREINSDSIISFSSDNSLLSDFFVKKSIVSNIPSSNTYYFDASVSGPTDSNNYFTDDANAFDGSTSTRSTFSTISGSTILSGVGTNAPSSGGDITEVTFRIYATESASGKTLIASVYYDNELLSTANVGSSLQWYGATITEPAGGWSWSVLQNLEVRIEAYSDLNLDDAYVHAIEINVTSGSDFVSDYSIFATSYSNLSSNSHILVSGEEDSLSSNYSIKDTVSEQLLSNAFVYTQTLETLNSSYNIKSEESQSLTSDSYILSSFYNDLESSYIITSGSSSDIESFSYIKVTDSSQISGSYFVSVEIIETLASDLWILTSEPETINSDYYLLSTYDDILQSNSYIIVLGEEDSLSANYYVLTTDSNTLNSDYVIVVVESDTLTSDSYISSTSSEALNSDYSIISSVSQTLTSDSYIKRTVTKTSYVTPIVDAFEDGNYTSDPAWSVINGSFSVTSTHAKNGTYGLKGADGTFSRLTYTHPSAIDLETQRWSTWVKFIDLEGDGFIYDLRDESNVGIQIQYEYISVLDERRLWFYYGGSGSYQLLTGLSVGDWIKIEISYTKHSNQAIAYAYDESDALLFSIPASSSITSPISSVKDINLYSIPGTGNSGFVFDDVTYSYEATNEGLISEANIISSDTESLISDYVIDTRRYDKFEDGDYTSSPDWSVVSGSWEVVSARPYEGTYSLRANSASFTSNYLEHTKLNSETITDSTWSVKTYSESSSAELGYILYDSDNNFISLGLTATQSPYISDSNGFDNTSIADMQDQWLTFQVTFNTGTGNYTVDILNSSGSSVFSRTRTNPLNNVKRVRLYTYYRSSEYTYFDNVTYGFEYVGTYGQLDSDSYIQNSFTATIESDSFIKQSLSNELSSDYSIISSVSESINSLSYINASDSNSLSATYFVIVLGEEGSLTSDYYISLIYDSVITSDYSLSNTESNPISSDYFVVVENTIDIDSDSYVIKTSSEDLASFLYIASGTYSNNIFSDLFIGYVGLYNTISGDAFVYNTKDNSLDSSYYVKSVESGVIQTDYYVLVLGEEDSLSSDYSITRVESEDISSNAHVYRILSDSLTSDSYLLSVESELLESDYSIIVTESENLTSDYFVYTTSENTIETDSYISVSEPQIITSDYNITTVYSETITSDAYITAGTIRRSITSGLFVGFVGLSDTITSDYTIEISEENTVISDYSILSSYSQSLLSSSYVLVLGEEDSLTSDYFITRTESQSISSDYHIYNILSDSLESDYSVLTSIEESLDGYYFIVSSKIRNTIDSDLFIGFVGLQDTITSDSVLLVSETESLESDSNIKASTQTSISSTLYVSTTSVTTVNSDSYLSITDANSISSEYSIVVSVEKSLESNYYINNDYKTTVLSDLFILVEGLEDSLVGSYAVKITDSRILSSSYYVSVSSDNSIGSDSILSSSIDSALSSDYSILASSNSPILSSYIVRAYSEVQLESSYYVRSADSENISSDYYVYISVVDTLESDYKLKTSYSETVDSDLVVDISRRYYLDSSLVISYSYAFSIESNYIVLPRDYQHPFTPRLREKSSVKPKESAFDKPKTKSNAEIAKPAVLGVRNAYNKKPKTNIDEINKPKQSQRRY